MCILMTLTDVAFVLTSTLTTSSKWELFLSESRILGEWLKLGFGYPLPLWYLYRLNLRFDDDCFLSIALFL